MPNLNKTVLTSEVRRAMDEFTLSGELALIDTDVEDLASSNFSDTDIGDELDRAARWVAARVKAEYLPDLVQTSLSIPSGALRLLGSRVKFNGIDCDRRTFQGHRKLEASGRPASNTYPVYVFEDMEFHVYADTTDPGGATGDWVVFPTLVSELQDAFRNAVVQRVVGILFFVLGQGEVSRIAFGKANNEIRRYLLRQPQDQLPG